MKKYLNNSIWMLLAIVVTISVAAEAINCPVFRYFKDSNSDGKISNEEVRTMFKNACPDASEDGEAFADVAAEFIGKFDKNSDGLIEREECSNAKDDRRFGKELGHSKYEAEYICNQKYRQDDKKDRKADNRNSVPAKGFPYCSKFPNSEWQVSNEVIINIFKEDCRFASKDGDEFAGLAAKFVDKFDKDGDSFISLEECKDDPSNFVDVFWGSWDKAADICDKKHLEIMEHEEKTDDERRNRFKGHSDKF